MGVGTGGTPSGEGGGGGGGGCAACTRRLGWRGAAHLVEARHWATAAPPDGRHTCLLPALWRAKVEQMASILRRGFVSGRPTRSAQNSGRYSGTRFNGQMHPREKGQRCSALRTPWKGCAAVPEASAPSCGAAGCNWAAGALEQDTPSPPRHALQVRPGSRVQTWPFRALESDPRAGGVENTRGGPGLAEGDLVACSHLPPRLSLRAERGGRIRPGRSTDPGPAWGAMSVEDASERETGILVAPTQPENYADSG